MSISSETEVVVHDVDWQSVADVVIDRRSVRY